MARSKNCYTREKPKGRSIEQIENPEKFYSNNPSWRFMYCDNECWPFTRERVNDCFWNEIFPKLQSFETQKWSDILVASKKQNHSIDPSKLHKQAQKRLEEKYIEAESIISLRLNGSHRLYGYITDAVFNIIWYDDDHGDNDTCVCRSILKHTLR